MMQARCNDLEHDIDAQDSNELENHHSGEATLAVEKHQIKHLECR